MKEDTFISNLHDLFDIADANALNMIKIEDKQFLISQRKDGRLGFMYAVNYAIQIKEDRIKKKKFLRKHRYIITGIFLKYYPLGKLYFS